MGRSAAEIKNFASLRCHCQAAIDESNDYLGASEESLRRLFNRHARSLQELYLFHVSFEHGSWKDLLEALPTLVSLDRVGISDLLAAHRSSDRFSRYDSEFFFRKKVKAASNYMTTFSDDRALRGQDGRERWFWGSPSTAVIVSRAF